MLAGMADAELADTEVDEAAFEEAEDVMGTSSQLLCSPAQVTSEAPVVVINAELMPH